MKKKNLSKPRSYASNFNQKSQAKNTFPTITQSLKSFSLPPLLLAPTSHLTSNTPKSAHIKYISLAKMQLRREKGLCYTCDDKFTPIHKCPNMQYLILHMEEDGSSELQPDPDDSSDHADN